MLHRSLHDVLFNYCVLNRRPAGREDPRSGPHSFPTELGYWNSVNDLPFPKMPPEGPCPPPCLTCVRGPAASRVASQGLSRHGASFRLCVSHCNTQGLAGNRGARRWGNLGALCLGVSGSGRKVVNGREVPRGQSGWVHGKGPPEGAGWSGLWGCEGRNEARIRGLGSLAHLGLTGNSLVLKGKVLHSGKQSPLHPEA